MNRIEGYRFASYLIGSMEHTAEGDDGSSKREIFEAELLKRNVFPINPVSLEKFKVGENTGEVKIKMAEWLKNRDFAKYKEISRLIWKGKDYYNDKDGLVHIPGDIDYVKMSNWITFVYNEGDQCCGSFGELFMAFEHDIPVYLITEVPIEKLKGSLLQGVFGSGGAIFQNIGQYLNFIENEYKVYVENKGE